MKKVHIILEPGQKVFFTSDLHVGHKNVIKFCNRPYSDVRAMSEGLIQNWNWAVGEDDVVFDLGDMFWWDSRHDVKRFIEKLNGHIYKVPGNHDMDCEKLFELCEPGKVTVLGDVNTVYVTGYDSSRPTKTKEIVVCHYPLATWPHRQSGAIQVFGHIHSGPHTAHEYDIPGKDLTLTRQQYDAGVDNNNYTPVELREILNKLNEQ